jgi:thymidine kinase
MFAGKTQLLLTRLAAAEGCGTQVLAVKPLIDTRWPDEIVSHGGARRPAVSVRESSEIVELARKHTLVCIDEAQFFGPDLIDAVAELQQVAHVLVAALDLNFRCEPFAVVSDLISQADTVHRLRAVCGSCGGSATLTQRFVDGFPAPFDDAVVRVGGDELYAPRCTRCYLAEREVAPVPKRVAI